MRESKRSEEERRRKLADGERDGAGDWINMDSD
jgi:hypothetical protein